MGQSLKQQVGFAEAAGVLVDEACLKQSVVGQAPRSLARLSRRASARSLWLVRSSTRASASRASSRMAWLRDSAARARNFSARV